MGEIAKNPYTEKIIRQKLEEDWSNGNSLWKFSYKIAIKLIRDVQESQAIANCVLMTAWEKAGMFRSHINPYIPILDNPEFKNWSAKTAKNRARLFGRKMKKFRDRHILYSDYCDEKDNEEVLPLEEKVASYETPPSLIIKTQERKDLEAALTELISKLSCKLETAIEMHYFENYSQSEIAKRLNIPFGTVQSRLYRARKILKKRLKNVVVNIKI